jgi:uncharacterized membrane protein YsdA (DUF1294 family)
MFHQIIGYRNVVNYWILAVQWWTCLKEVTAGFQQFCIFLSLLVFLDFDISKKEFLKNLAFQKTTTQPEKILWYLFLANGLVSLFMYQNFQEHKTPENTKLIGSEHRNIM